MGNKWKKNPGYWQKYPETQTTPKKPRSSGKNPAVATLIISVVYKLANILYKEYGALRKVLEFRKLLSCRKVRFSPISMHFCCVRILFTQTMNTFMVSHILCLEPEIVCVWHWCLIIRLRNIAIYIVWAFIPNLYVKGTWFELFLCIIMFFLSVFQRSYL